MGFCQLLLDFIFISFDDGFFIQDEDRFNLAASFTNEEFSQHIQRFIQGHSERSCDLTEYNIERP